MSYKSLIAGFIVVILGVTMIPHSARAASPVGYFDVINSDGIAMGWAFDPDHTTVNIQIHFYIDGVFAGNVGTTDTRPDVNTAYGITGTHAFVYSIPAKYNDGKSHLVYAYGIDLDDSTGSSNILLGNSPISYTSTSGIVPPVLSGNTHITANVESSPLVISTSANMAGAITSLTWNGKEFINSYDHGRELQSALSYDNIGECNNPTEAGGSYDNITSSSVLQSMTASGNTLTSQTSMAAWLTPGYNYGKLCNPNLAGSPSTAQNTGLLDNTILNKKVIIGLPGVSENIIQYETKFTIPAPHNVVTFESLVGYMPADFSSKWTYNPKTQVLTSGSNVNGNLPVIVSTADQKYAMGVYAPEANMLYGTQQFGTNPNNPADTSVWNCVGVKTNVTAGSQHTYHCYVIVGSLAKVQADMSKLYLSLGSHPFSINNPVGVLDTADNGVLGGWAFDPDSANNPINLEIYLDGPKGFGALVRTIITTGTRADVNQAYGISGTHGFGMIMPDLYKDGLPHTIYVYGIDTDDGTAVQIGSSKTFTMQKLIPTSLVRKLNIPVFEGRTTKKVTGVLNVLDSSKVLMKSYPITTDSNGEVKITFDMPAQTVFLQVNAAPFLSRIISVDLNLDVVYLFPTALAGDANGDGIINSVDSSILKSKWFTEDPIADLNQDHIVNSLDLSILDKNWFRSAQ